MAQKIFLWHSNEISDTTDLKASTPWISIRRNFHTTTKEFRIANA